MAESPILLWQPSGGSPPGTPGTTPPVYSQADSTALIEGQPYVDVVFGSIQTNDEWVLVGCAVVNEIDPDPLNIWPGIITDKAASGFRIQLNGMPDSDNYYLHWAVSGVNIAPVPATLYYFSGPATGGIHVESTNFTVSLPPSTTLSGTLTIIPDDGGAGGVFSPTSVTLTTTSASATFTYTPVGYGAITLSVTNSGTLIDPASLAFNVIVTTYTLSGPSTGTSGVASTDFTVALPVGGPVVGTVTVTPSSGGGGGTFTPTSVGLTTGAPSATFTYTPSTVGAKTISVTNSGGLTDPDDLTYTVTAPASHLLNTLISYWKLDEASGTRNDSQGTNHLAPAGGPVGATGIINNGLQLVRASGQYVSHTSNSSLEVTSDFTFSIWFKMNSIGVNMAFINKGLIGSGNQYTLAYFTGTGLLFWVNEPLGGATAAVGPTLTAGVWYHAAAWFDSVTGQVYLRINDTTTYQSPTSPGLLAPAAYDLNIGAEAGGAFVDGIVDEIGFWKRTLTATEITALYNGGAGWPFSSFTS